MSRTETNGDADTVLILAPLGQDGPLAARVLGGAGIHAEIVNSLPELCKRIETPAAAVLVAEEAFTTENRDLLREKLSGQPTWSDLPIVLLTSRKERLLTTQFVLGFFPTGGNIAILERPFRSMTLITAMNVALRSRQRQYQVRDLLRAQESALRQRDEFLSVASHELKTPITTIKLQIQMRRRYIRRGDTSIYRPENVNVLLEKTESQVERLSRLVDDMLDVSRIESGKLSLSLESVDLGALVESVADGFMSEFEAADCSVSIETGGTVVGWWDRYRLEQVIANLFTNAIKYGLGAPVSIRLGIEGDLAVLRVRDEGPGIAPEDHDRIFDRFERVKTSDKIGGLGLGLYITRQIVELHGGRIRVESRPDEGSEFVVELPFRWEGKAIPLSSPR